MMESLESAAFNHENFFFHRCGTHKVRCDKLTIERIESTVEDNVRAEAAQELEYSK